MDSQKQIRVHVSQDMHSSLVVCKNAWRLRSLDDTIKVLVNFGLSYINAVGDNELLSGCNELKKEISID